ncbi:MAG TPA: TonB-dependent receptor [Candidatus Omnitrophota bacterium]|nr:TonB-dependent receptor [Candidatus Omnitrophota bacterium]
MDGTKLRSAIPISLILLLIFLNACFAEKVDLDEIIVTASRSEEYHKDSSREVDIITSQDIEDSQAHDISDALDELNSVEITNYGGIGSSKLIKMRGSTASQVLILIDGRPVNSPRDGEVDLSTIPLENIEKIEVMRGLASSLYGSSAMGGTIQIITKNPPKEGSTAQVLSSFGTFRTYQERLSAGQRIGKFGYILTGDYQSSAGFRENSAFDAKDLSIKMDYDISEKQRLWINTGFYTNRSGAPGPINAVDLDDKQYNDKNFIDLNWNVVIDNSSSASLKLYNNYDRLLFSENTAGSIFDIANNRSTHTTKSRGIDLQVSKEFSDFYKAITGINNILNLNDSTSSAKHKYSVFAWFLNNEFDFSQNLKGNASLRLDDYSNFGLQASPSVSALYRVNDKLKFHGLLSRSFRAPTFNDLYWPDEGWAIGNPNLKPETGLSSEAGISAQVNKYYETDLTYFRNHYDELIQWAESGGVWSPTNIGSALTNGVEWENRFFPLDNIELNAGYTYQIPKDEKTNKFLIYQPEHKVNFAIKHHNVFGWEMSLKGEWNGLRYHDALNTIKVDGYFLLGFFASKSMNRNTTFYLNISNALNKKYQSVLNYPAPGFDLTSGIKIEF